MNNLSNLKKKMISIIIVNYNWKKWLEKCISSLLNQSYKDFEIIFVDNASVDDSIEYMKSTFKDDRIKIIENNENSWFAWWNNLGYKFSKWEYILLLNNDTWVEENFLENFINEFKKWNIDILWVTEKKYNQEEYNLFIPKIDFFWHPIYFKTKINWNIINLFYTSWVCILFKSELYKKTWWLDNDFFMYFEEIDWMWRIRLYGYKIWQLINLFVYHAGAWTTWTWIKYNSFLWRNQNTLQMLLKNYSFHNLLWVLPIYLTINLFEILFFLIILKPKISYTYIKWWIYNIKILWKTLVKRKEIQKKRIISDKEIMWYMYRWFWKIRHLINYFFKNG